LSINSYWITPTDCNGFDVNPCRGFAVKGCRGGFAVKGCREFDGNGCGVFAVKGCRLFDGNGCGVFAVKGCRLFDANGCGVAGAPSLTPIKSTTMVQNKARIVFVCIMLFYDLLDVYNILVVSEGHYIYIYMIVVFLCYPFWSHAVTYRIILVSIGQYISLSLWAMLSLTY